jgi:hypothetical protein
MIDLKELKAKATHASECCEHLWVRPEAILNLLDVIRVQGEALEYVAGARCERHMCTCYRDSTIIAISKTQTILGGE